MTLIWLRHYPTIHKLSAQFGITKSSVHRILHATVLTLHTYLVPKYIRWHSMNHWRRLAGSYAEWPQVVGEKLSTDIILCHSRKTF